jgi:hypothetical protein
LTDSNVATNKTVIVSGLTLNGPDAGNYLLTQPTSTANVLAASTMDTVVSSSNPALPASDITFTASVSVLPPGGGVPTGPIVFKDGTTVLGTNTLIGSSASLNTAELLHGTHTITAEYGGDGNFLGSTNSFSQIMDTPPVAGSTTLQRYPEGGAKIRTAALLTNDSDADGDMLNLVLVGSTSASGGTIATQGDWICYQPPKDFTNSDSFSYIVADSLGLQSTGSVTITIGSDTNAPQNFAPPNGIGHNLATVQFLGIPQRVYAIQYTTNLSTPIWQTLGTATAGGTGLIQVFDDPPDGSPPRYYRTTNP